MIRVVVVAASPVVRAGLESLAGSSPELQVSAALPDFNAVEDIPSDVVLAAVSEVPQLTRPVPIVLLTAEAQPFWSIDAVRAGVRAILPRDATQEQILAAVLSAASGLATVDPADLETLAGASVQPAADGPELTPRELEVLRMIAEGAANKTIAWKLGISEHTVKFHVASILNRLGAGTRTEAVTIGIRRGLILL